MNSRPRREHAGSLAKDDHRIWIPPESDTDRPRQTTSSSQRQNLDSGTGHDRHHRSTRRADPSDNPLVSSSASAHYKSSGRDPVLPLSSNYANESQYQVNSNAATVATAPNSSRTSSRSRTKDAHEAYDLRAYLTRRADKRSSPSSDEKVLGIDQPKVAHSSIKSRNGHAAAAPASTQTYWIPPEQAPREAATSLRHRDRDRDREKDRTRDRDRDRDKEKERDRERRKEKERAKAKEDEKERLRSKEKARIRKEVKAREREAERMREAERERDREREQRREEKERERERRREDKERRRRQEERERTEKPRETEIRRNDDNRGTDYPSGYVSHAPSARSGKHRGDVDDRTATRQGYADQIPSSSSNVVLPTTQYVSTSRPSGSTQPTASADIHRDGPTSASHGVPSHLTDRDRKHRRTHRDRPPAQHNVQESGLSSSEQEHSGRERGARTADRRFLTRDYADGNPSGPSGSENERTAGKERRKHSRNHPGDGHNVDPYARRADDPIATIEFNKSSDPRQPPTQVYTSELAAQTTAPVGPTTFAPYMPQIVSIRAGQGPSDPQTPGLHSKTPLSNAVPTRSRDPASVERSLLPDSSRNQPGFQHASISMQQHENMLLQSLHTRLDNSILPQNSVTYPQTVVSASQQAAAISSHRQTAQLPGSPPNRADGQTMSASAPLKPYPAQQYGSYAVDTPARPPSAAAPRSHSAVPSTPLSNPTLHSQTLGVPPSSLLKSLPTPPDVDVYSSKIGLKSTEVHLGAIATDPQSAAHLTKLSVYRSPGPVLATDLAPTRAPTHDAQYFSSYDAQASAARSRFPLNEEALAQRSGGKSGYLNEVTNHHVSHIEPLTATENTSRLPVQGNHAPPRSVTHPVLSNAHSTLPPVPTPLPSSPPRRTYPMPGDDTPRAAPIPIPYTRGQTPSSSQRPHPLPGEDTPRAAPIPIPQPRPPSSRSFPMPGEDTPRAAPIPIPEPRSPSAGNALQISQSYPDGQSYDPRSPKQNIATPAPIISSSPFQSGRPPVSSVQVKSTPLPTSNAVPASTLVDVNGFLHPNSRSTQPAAQSSMAAASLMNISAPVHSSSHSPLRNAHLTSLRSPPPSAGTPLISTTPKHSPSSRLHTRNGSNDTITQPIPSKHSPTTIPVKPLHQPSNMVNTQSHAFSRTDTPARPPTATPSYSDPARYRSPAPTTAFHFPAPAQQQPSHALSTTAAEPTSMAPNPVPQPYSSMRAASQPVHSVATHDHTTGTQRNQPTPFPPSAVPPTGQTSASAIVAAYRNGTYQTESSSRPSETAGGFVTASGQRVPPRAAPSPAPTINARLQNAMTPSVTKTGYAPSIVTPQPVRGQSFPVPSRSTATPHPSSHSRTASDPLHGTQSTQSTRVAVAGHPSTPAPSKAQLAALNISSPAPRAQENELLRTPSSLAPSMLLRGNSFSSIRVPPPTVSTQEKEKEERKKGGFFKIFRSRSSPPKQEEVRPPVLPKGAQRPRTSSQSTMNAVASSVKNIVSPHPTNIRAPIPTPIGKAKPKAPPAPAPGRDVPATSNVFPQFRLLSKRHHTVSSASVEALDGTTTNTVIGADSTRSSTAGRLSPPLRDPMVAAQDWRNQEEATLRGRNKARRYRPGVTFDVDEEPVVDAYRPSRRPSRR